MKELVELCERNNLELSLQYGEGDDVWDMDITDGDRVVCSLFIYKGGFDELAATAVDTIKRYIAAKNQTELFK